MLAFVSVARMSDAGGACTAGSDGEDGGDWSSVATDGSHDAAERSPVTQLQPEYDAVLRDYRPLEGPPDPRHRKGILFEIFGTTRLEPEYDAVLRDTQHIVHMGDWADRAHRQLELIGPMAPLAQLWRGATRHRFLVWCTLDDCLQLATTNRAYQRAVQGGLPTARFERALCDLQWQDWSEHAQWHDWPPCTAAQWRRAAHPDCTCEDQWLARGWVCHCRDF